MIRLYNLILIMHKVKTQRSRELLVKNMLILYFFSMVIIKKLLSEKNI